MIFSIVRPPFVLKGSAAETVAVATQPKVQTECKCMNKMTLTDIKSCLSAVSEKPTCFTSLTLHRSMSLSFWLEGAASSESGGEGGGGGGEEG